MAQTGEVKHVVTAGIPSIGEEGEVQFQVCAGIPSAWTAVGIADADAASYVNVSDDWKEVKNIFVLKDGRWKTGRKRNINVNSTWERMN
jgi:hypothetical protein